MLGRKSFLLFLSRIIAALLSYVGLYAMLRYYGDDGYGSVTWTLAFVTTFNVISDLGFSNAHIKRISEGKDLDDCISTFATIKLLLTFVMAVLTISVVLIWTLVLGEKLEDSSIEMVLLVILYYVMFDIAAIATTTFTAKMEMAKVPIVTIVDPIIRVPLVLLACLWMLSLTEMVALAYGLSALAVMAVSLYLLFRSRIKWRRPTLLRSYYKFALPLAYISAISVLSGTIDKLVLGIFYTNVEIGIYSAPQAFLGVFAVIGTAVATLTYPSFSKLFTDGNIEKIRKLTQEAERYIMMISLPITILLIMFPDEICNILLPTVPKSAEVFGIMAVTNLLLMLNSVDSTQIIAVDRPDITARITLIGFITTAGALFLLVPDSSFLGIGLGLSYVGAALALLIGRIVSYITTRYVIWHLTGTIPDWRLVYQLVAGLAVAALLYFLTMVIAITRWYDLVFYGLVSLGVFVAVLYALKEFTRKDLDYFLDLMDIRAMASYIRDELKSR